MHSSLISMSGTTLAHRPSSGLLIALAFMCHLASNALVQSVRDGQSATVSPDMAWSLVAVTAAAALTIGYPISRMHTSSSDSW